MPDLGEGTKEATIKEWYVKPGSKVEEFDDLVEVFTDKLVAKIPSTCTGYVKAVHFKEDEVCLVGHIMIDIEVEGEGAEVYSQPVEQATQPVPEVVQSANESIRHGPGK